ncbi:hypothetical protein JRQ81_012199 [Phrynocephalus forsythii]|uniref:Uncharacterized protein n=1 Tax=Phrynocephalus forsythii TaxID=171643 RepID=A0A9Q0X5F2_9SAUR|nr:hypothetical protein JRQ81_012199 [Phrynocephalus forsythii]
MVQKETGQGSSTDEFLGALDGAEEPLEGDQNSHIEMGGGIKCPSQTSSLLPPEGQGRDQTRADEGQRQLQEAGPSLQVAQQSPTEPGRENLVWQVLKEEEEEKNEDPLDTGMVSQIKMETSQGGGNQAGDPPRTTPWISRKNGRKTLQEGSRSREKLGDQPLETEEAPPTGLNGGLSDSVHQSSNVQTSDKRPLVSRYGRKYHYLHELNIADSTEDHVESRMSEENLQQHSPCDKQGRKLTGKRKLESSENSLEGNQRNHLEEKSRISPERGNRLSGAKSPKETKGFKSPASDELLDAKEESIEGDQNSDIAMGSGIKCPSQTSSLLPPEGQGRDQTRADEGQRQLQEAGPSLQVVQQSPTEPGRENLVWQVLKEDEEEKNEDPLGIGMGSQIKMETSQGIGSQAEDLPGATPRISQKNGRKKLGDQPLETEEAPPTGLTGGLSASVHQSSNVRTSDKRPLVSRYGRKYHYLHELDIADSTEDHVESWTSEENLQQHSSCDKQDRKLTRKSLRVGGCA